MTVIFQLISGRKLATLGLLWLLLILGCAVFAPLIAPFDPLEIDPVSRLSEPGGSYLFGTDHFGRDTLSRCIYGARMALIIGLGSVTVSLVFGGLIGMLSAYFTRLGMVLMRVVDVAMAFPA
ncbi:MAG: ABC transporter permease, partial [Cohaesibacteraceae bacterium]|nr:ABC transporter permease [Cohaesibacteraceae bacterium]